MQSYKDRLTLLVSSQSSSLFLQRHQLDGIADDVFIAQELLQRPRIPNRASSVRRSSSGLSPSKSPNVMVATGSRRSNQSSNIWAFSNAGISSEQEDIEDRSLYLRKYNELAGKLGIQQLVLDGSREENTPMEPRRNISEKTSSWFSRKILRRLSTQTIEERSERHVKIRRSISDISIRAKVKKDTLKDKNLQDLVRLCGSSLLYLPTDYAAASLDIPTCLRATAQYLVQHGPPTRGLFRIPGSHQTVSALYNHYFILDTGKELVSGTVRCPSLPDHIQYDVHDIASTFKKFLSGLPGGILGSLSLFNALLSIQDRLHGESELTKTKYRKTRARLIALAIASVSSRHRRELICAVCGLLCLVGRVAETAKGEDDRGRSLPTTGLMGYSSLGIVFGPLLVNELLDKHVMRATNFHAGLVPLPPSPKKSWKDKHQKQRMDGKRTFNAQVDKVKVASGIAEMLMTHWREVVRQMKNLNALKRVQSSATLALPDSKPRSLRPSASDGFNLRMPPDWDVGKSIRVVESSPSPARGVSVRPLQSVRKGCLASCHTDMLMVRKQLSRQSQKTSEPTEEEQQCEPFFCPDNGSPCAHSPSATGPSSGSKTVTCSADMPSPSSKLLTSGRILLYVDSPQRLKKLSPVGSPFSRRLQVRRNPECRPSKDSIKASPPKADLAGRTVSKRGLQITASDPGVQESFVDYSLQPTRRLISSTDPVARSERGKAIPRGTRRRATGKVNALPSASSDPLSQISNEEDLASLAALAQVIYSSDESAEPSRDPGVTMANAPELESKGIAKSEGHSQVSQTVEMNLPVAPRDPVLLSVIYTENITGGATRAGFRTGNAASTHTKNSEAGPSQKSLATRFTRSQSSLDQFFAPVRNSANPTHRDGLTGRLQELTSSTWLDQKATNQEGILTSSLGISISGCSDEHNKSQHSCSASSKASTIITHRQQITPRRQSVNYTLSRRSFGNVKELAAKFENAPSTSTAVSSSFIMPAKFQKGSESPRYGLLAQYTANWRSSPSHSQKSVKSCPSGHLSSRSSSTRDEHITRLGHSSVKATTPVSDHKSPRRTKWKSVDNAPLAPIQVTRHSIGHANTASRQPSSTQDTRLHGLQAPMVDSQSAGSEVQPIENSNIESMRSSFNTTRSPGNNSIVLHDQIQALQQDLSTKEAEIRQLKRQSEARVHVATLDEQLRSTRRELYTWRSRAEEAEYRLETRRGRSRVKHDRPTSEPSEENTKSFWASCKNYPVSEMRTLPAIHASDNEMSLKKAAYGDDGDGYGCWAKDTLRELDRSNRPLA